MEKKRVYVYDSHLGGIYTSDVKFEPEICWTCGDCDYLIGEVSSLDELKELVTDRDYDEDGNMYYEWCGYSDEYLAEIWSEVE